MNLPSSSNSSAENGTSGLAHCACCHEFGQVRPHWDHPDVPTCEPCRQIIFTLEAFGPLSHTAYAFFVRLNGSGRGGL